MNGYKLLADSYRKLKLEMGEDTKLDKHIKVLDFLASCDKEEINYLYDSSAFNYITEAYCDMAMYNAGIDTADRRKALDELHSLFSQINASEISKTE